MNAIVPIRRALFSVYDKTGLIELARALAQGGAELLASGGTRSALVDAGLPVTEVADYTGQPEILGGRVKTLHPKIHAGILARRDLPADLQALEAQGFAPIDLVVVNLYPFEATIARPDATFADAVENIDVGGPTLLRAAAKNHEHVAAVSSTAQYASLIASIIETGGTTREARRRLAAAAFERTGEYDNVDRRLHETSPRVSRPRPPAFPQKLDLRFSLRGALRYGENPHQQAAFYRRARVSRAQPGDREAVARKGTLVQQLARPRQRPAPGSLVRVTGGLHPQA